MSEPSLSVIKALFAVSGNICAFPPCEERLTDPAWRQVNADIAHIRGKKPEAARHDPNMTDEERDAFENLLLLCPNHHRLIDRLAPDSYTVEMLQDMKAKHEERNKAAQWAIPSDLDLYARLSLQEMLLSLIAPRPRLRVEKSGDQIEVLNFGDGDAVSLSMEPLDAGSEEAFLSSGDPPRRMSPGGRWRAGIHAATFGDAGPHAVRVRWQDTDGRSYEGEFPL